MEVAENQPPLPCLHGAAWQAAAVRSTSGRLWAGAMLFFKNHTFRSGLTFVINDLKNYFHYTEKIFNLARKFSL